jgi:dsDNA-specific endonuclease/ATPase MutS2
MLLEAPERAALEWNTLLDHLAGRCATDAGKAAARTLEPLPDLDERRQRLRLVSA